MRLTAKERILIHLLDQVRHAESVEVPEVLTQSGVARLAGIALPHVVQYARPLVKDGLVQERIAHVEGSKRRRKVYNLTSEGRMVAIRLRARLKLEVVHVKDAQGTREATIGQVLEQAGPKLLLSQVVIQAAESGFVDLIVPIASDARPPFVEMMGDAPKLGTFVGRQEELEALTREDAPAMVVVRGVAGIGKTSFAVRACQSWWGRRNILWRRVQPWDTHVSLLADVGHFLAAVGRPGLRTVLGRGGVPAAMGVLRQDLSGSRSFLVFDDVHDASPEAISFFRFLKESLKDCKEVTVLVLARHALPFYDRRDVSIRKLVVEIELAGLSREDIRTLLKDRDVEGLVQLGQRLGGHPLFFDLLRAHPVPSRAMRDLGEFMEEQIYRTLPGPQRTMMKLASLYRVPVPREALFLGGTLSYDTLLALRERFLLRSVGEDRLVLHDTIRDFFASVMATAERKEFEPFASAQLRRLGMQALDHHDPLAAIDAASNALELSADQRERLELLETLGDASDQVGDFDRAVNAYRGALQIASEPESRARLRRKTAAEFENHGDLDAACAELTDALKVLGDSWSVERGRIMALLCHVSWHREELEEAREYGEEAIRIFRLAGDVRGEGRALAELGRLEQYQDPERARPHLESALRLLDRVNDPEVAAKVRIFLAALDGLNGKPERGFELLAIVQGMPEVSQDLQVQRLLHSTRGYLNLLVEGDFVAAEQGLAKAISVAQKNQDPVAEISANFDLATLKYYRRQLVEARVAFDEAAEGFKDHGYRGFAVEAKLWGARCGLLTGDVSLLHSGIAWIGQLSLARGVEARRDMVEALRGLERLAARDDEGMQAAFRVVLERNPSSYLYGVALRVLGKEVEAEAQLARAKQRAEERKRKPWLSFFDEETDRLVKVLREARRASTSPRLRPVE